MAEDYTPTTEHVRVTFGYHGYRRTDEAVRPTVSGRLAEFDRWLAAHDAETLRAERARIAANIEAARPVREHVGYQPPPPEGCLCDECYVTAQRQIAFEDAARIALGEQP